MRRACFRRLLPVLPLLLAVDAAPSAELTGPLPVYILAGQSNMVGQAKMSLVEYQAAQPATAARYAPFRRDGKWIERDDVWIKYFERKGRLTVGFGARNAIGPELGFGWTVGDRLTTPVLLIKTAWGGRSVYRDFRSPSAGLPAQEVLDKMLADARKRKPTATPEEVRQTFGASYRAMLDEVNQTLADLKTVFPELAATKPELAGFIWFQGWNDMIDPVATSEYAANLAHFIRDVRKDLKAPALPFVIGQMGVDGLNANEGVQRFKAAQTAAAELPEFKGNVALVKTDVFWDTEADAVFRKGWRQNIEEWNKVGSDFPYHYLGSARTLIDIGRALGEAALALRAGR
jgi:alpha-galactosidase